MTPPCARGFGAVNPNPNRRYIKAIQSLGFCRWKQHRLEEALSLFHEQEGIVGPASAILCENIGHTHSSLGDLEKVSGYRDSPSVSPSHPPRWPDWTQFWPKVAPLLAEFGRSYRRTIVQRTHISPTPQVLKRRAGGTPEGMTVSFDCPRCSK